LLLRTENQGLIDLIEDGLQTFQQDTTNQWKLWIYNLFKRSQFVYLSVFSF